MASGERSAVVDERPVLIVSGDTWAREDAAGRVRLIHAAGGYRVAVNDRDGATWTPDDDPSAWVGR